MPAFSDFILPAPEGHFFMLLDTLCPGIGIACTSYYGSKGCDFMVFGAGAGLVCLQIFLEISAWTCEFFGLNGISWAWATIVGAVLILGYVVAFFCRLLRFLSWVYAIMHQTMVVRKHAACVVCKSM